MVADPYGGRLVNRVLSDKEKIRMLSEINEVNRIDVDKRTVLDAEKIAYGAYSPLEGFVGEDDFKNIVEKETLSNGLPWTIPIFLALKEEECKKEEELKIGEELALYYEGKPIAIMYVDEIFKYNKKELMRRVYGTTEPDHPEVARIASLKDRAISGVVDLLQPVDEKFLLRKELTPAESREEFRRRGWRSIAAYQTRNPPHVAHEYLQRCALEITDGLFIHPVIGELKKDDFPPNAIIESYDYLINHYYNSRNVILSPLSISMRYAGPKAAVFLAIIRKNYGCTHFIVGRDMAGVGGYYKPYEAHEKFKEIDLGIEPILFKESFYCKRCKRTATNKTCGHDLEDHVKISMTQVRNMISQGIDPPSDIIRPEILNILKKYIRSSN